MSIGHFYYIANILKPLWYFIEGLIRQAFVGFMIVLGRIRVTKYIPFFSYDPTGYAITSHKIRLALSLLKPGDVVCRYYKGFVDGWFIPGRFSHTGVYIGVDGGAETIIHALGSGVQKIDVLDFLRCDGFAILRPKDSASEKACEIAHSYLGYSYDFFFDVCDDYSNKSEVQKRTRAVYCHELTRSCYPDLNIPTIKPVLWGGMIRSNKSQFLAQSFFESEDFTLIYDSDYSEARCDQK